MKTKTPNYVKVAIVLTIVNLLILAIRNYLVGDTVFAFLKSNLFIGSLPTLVIAYLLWRFYNKLNNFFFWLGTALWVLFYPNSPYMITDLIHNSQDSFDSEMIKYDTMIIFSIAMLSVYYGFLSLKIMFSLFKIRHGIRFARYAIIATLLLSCLGFYIGREVLSGRDILNGYTYSWEIFFEPIQIIKNTWKALWPIGQHLSAYYMMALFGAVQFLLVIIFKTVSNIETGSTVIKD